MAAMDYTKMNEEELANYYSEIRCYMKQQKEEAIAARKKFAQEILIPALHTYQEQYGGKIFRGRWGGKRRSESNFEYPRANYTPEGYIILED